MNVADLMHRLSKLPPHYMVFFAHPHPRSDPNHVEAVNGIREGRYVGYEGHNVVPVRESSGDPEDEIDSIVLLRFEEDAKR